MSTQQTPPPDALQKEAVLAALTTVASIIYHEDVKIPLSELKELLVMATVQRGSELGLTRDEISNALQTSRSTVYKNASKVKELRLQSVAVAKEIDETISSMLMKGPLTMPDIVDALKQQEYPEKLIYVRFHRMIVGRAVILDEETSCYSLPDENFETVVATETSEPVPFTPLVKQHMITWGALIPRVVFQRNIAYSKFSHLKFPLESSASAEQLRELLALYLKVEARAKELSNTLSTMEGPERDFVEMSFAITTNRHADQD